MKTFANVITIVLFGFLIGIGFWMAQMLLFTLYNGR